MPTVVICSTSFEGLHRWPEAPDDVFFLRYPHRHMFHVKLAVRVSHDDRDVEFILLKRSLDRFIQREYPLPKSEAEVTPLSCEMIARAICFEFDAEWVEVWEDDENGARVEKKHGNNPL